MKWFNDLKVGAKLVGGFLAVALLIVVVAVVGYTNLKSVNAGSETMYRDRLIPIRQLGKAESALMKIRGNLYQMTVLPEGMATWEKDVADSIAVINEQINEYRATYLVQEEKDGLAKFDSAWATYQKEVAGVIAKIKAGDVQAAVDMIKDGGSTANARVEVQKMMGNLIAINERVADEVNQQNDRTFANATRVSLVVALFGVLLAVGLGVFISRNITAPLAIMAGAMQNLAKGDLNRHIAQSIRDAIMAREDELGTVGKGLGATEIYLQEMAGVAGRIADGDLTVSVTPRSEKDELGNAFARMVASLRQQVGQIAESAMQVEAASAQLASAAEQAGSATNQVASTIQQVAQGTSTQATQATQATAAVEQMSRKVEGIAQGVAKQEAAVENVSQAVATLNDTLQEVAKATSLGNATAQRAAQAAQAGAQTVERTVQGMNALNESASVVAQKVREMGQRSEEIGKIVSTIQDIAAQTDLLALNAAIEAARAGDQGRGFAVVADEVRKLAERAAAASREIADLVRLVQKGTEEAVKATDASVESMNRSTREAMEAGEALREILGAAEQNKEAVGNIEVAAGRIQEIARRLAEEVKIVSAVSKENLAATKEMGGMIAEVAQAAESVAAAAEENSASVEEVSATAEELSAQVEEVSASAQELASLAEALREVVAQFKLGDGQQEVGVRGGPAGARPVVKKGEAPVATNGRKREVQVAAR